jgi:5-methylcytosine-specific restriction enzyme subunit McrC
VSNVLGLLKDVYGSEVEFQFEADRNNQLDYLLNSSDEKLVIDAKYKPKYIRTKGKEETDIRQISGYARLKKVYKELYGNEDFDKIISGLIIYPDQKKGITKIDKGKLKLKPIQPYINIFKMGIKLPVIN